MQIKTEKELPYPLKIRDDIFVQNSVKRHLLYTTEDGNESFIPKTYTISEFPEAKRAQLNTV